MKRSLDLMLSTQVSTSIAWIFAILAHLVANHANANWQFMVYVLLILSMGFMAMPYIFLCNDGETNEPQR